MEVLTQALLSACAQVMSVYIQTGHFFSDLGRQKSTKPRLRVLDLGAGTGLVSLTLAKEGHHVVATDLPSVMPLLCRNLSANAPAISADSKREWSIRPQELDWTSSTLPDVPVDLIVTTDTIYIESLYEPLLRTLRHFVQCSSGRCCTTLLGLERRDPPMVDHFFALARSTGWVCERIDPLTMHHCGSLLGWSEDDYDGVELWTLKLD